MLTLHAGQSSLTIAPEIGGAVVGWIFGADPVLRRPMPEAIIQGVSRGLAAYPLVPYSNRIANARFTFAGRSYQLARNFGDEPNSIHGVGWTSVWDVAEVSDSAARLILTHTAEGDEARGWPFPFTAELHYGLAADGLTVGLSMRNRHTEPAPAGLGLHPFFPRTPDASLRFAADGVWLNGGANLPVKHEPVPADWNHADGRHVGSATLDNLFTGWPGEALIALRPSPVVVRLTASEIFRRLVVYVPPGRSYFAVEPVSHMSDAINRLDTERDTGLRILAPGEELAGEIRFRLQAS